MTQTSTIRNYCQRPCSTERFHKRAENAAEIKKLSGKEIYELYPEHRLPERLPKVSSQTNETTSAALLALVRRTGEDIDRAHWTIDKAVFNRTQSEVAEAVLQDLHEAYTIDVGAAMYQEGIESEQNELTTLLDGLTLPAESASDSNANLSTTPEGYSLPNRDKDPKNDAKIRYYRRSRDKLQDIEKRSMAQIRRIDGLIEARKVELGFKEYKRPGVNAQLIRHKQSSTYTRSRH